MYKKRIYLDTSVISYLYENDSPEKMRITLNLWDLFKRELYDIYISDIVIQEISKCNEKKLRILLDYLGQINYNIIETEENIAELAKTFIEAGILRQKSFEDCLHIAAAILAGCDIITSWDFKHIVNKKTVDGINFITELMGYKGLLVYSPSFFLESRDNYE